MNWKKMLLAVNDTGVSMRAVQYVGEMCEGVDLVEICLLHIAPVPPPSICSSGHTYDEYVSEREEKARRTFADAAEVLARYHIDPARVRTKIHITAQGETISQAILREQAGGEYGTVVVGKRGVSRAEEFLFGSISNAVVQKCSFTVWVVG